LRDVVAYHAKKVNGDYARLFSSEHQEQQEDRSFIELLRLGSDITRSLIANKMPFDYARLY
jgi:hypothetical protein